MLVMGCKMCGRDCTNKIGRCDDCQELGNIVMKLWALCIPARINLRLAAVEIPQDPELLDRALDNLGFRIHPKLEPRSILRLEGATIAMWLLGGYLMYESS